MAKPTRQPETSAAQKLNNFETELQVMQKEDEATTMGVVRGASMGEVPVTQVIPTVFVWHGQLVDDHL